LREETPNNIGFHAEKFELNMGKNRKHHLDEGTGHDEPNLRFTKESKALLCELRKY